MRCEVSGLGRQWFEAARLPPACLTAQDRPRVITLSFPSNAIWKFFVSAVDDDAPPFAALAELIELKTNIRILPHPFDFLSRQRKAVDLAALQCEGYRHDVGWLSLTQASRPMRDEDSSVVHSCGVISLTIMAWYSIVRGGSERKRYCNVAQSIRMTRTRDGFHVGSSVYKPVRVSTSFPVHRIADRTHPGSQNDMPCTRRCGSPCRAGYSRWCRLSGLPGRRDAENSGSSVRDYQRSG
jgi:hypothetical protein